MHRYFSRDTHYYIKVLFPFELNFFYNFVHLLYYLAHLMTLYNWGMWEIFECHVSQKIQKKIPKNNMTLI